MSFWTDLLSMTQTDAMYYLYSIVERASDRPKKFIRDTQFYRFNMCPMEDKMILSII